MPSGNLGLRSSRLLWEISRVNNRLTVVFSRRWRQAAQLDRPYTCVLALIHATTSSRTSSTLRCPYVPMWEVIPRRQATSGAARLSPRTPSWELESRLLVRIGNDTSNGNVPGLFLFPPPHRIAECISELAALTSCAGQRLSVQIPGPQCPSDVKFGGRHGIRRADARN